MATRILSYNISRWQLSIGQHNEETKKPALRYIIEVVENRLIGFAHCLSMLKTFKDYTGSVTHLLLPSSSPGWYR